MTPPPRVLRLQRPRGPGGPLQGQMALKGDGASGCANLEDLCEDLQGQDAGRGTEEGRTVAGVIEQVPP